MLTTYDEIDALLDVPARLCGCCGKSLPASSFSTDRNRRSGFDRHCRSCRREQAADRRARQAADAAVPAPAPKGRGPERLEPGAILLALDELEAMPTLVRFEGHTIDVLPRALRRRAVVGVDGVPVVARQVLIDWVRAQRKRVGEYRIRGRPEDRSFTEPIDTRDARWRHKRDHHEEE